MTTPTVARGLDALRFDNRFIAELPADPIVDNQRRQVSGACYSNVLPSAVRAPQLVACAEEVAALLDLQPADCRSAQFRDVVAGNRQLPGMAPYATCYGGHQFGNWAGQLGDGRAINLGEIVNQRNQRWALQLKGAGPTPYSRSADGLAVLRSSLREFLCSEAMHHLGVPSTRALSLVLTGEEVLRDMFYDGNPQYEPGAVVCRVAPSFTRFGHFEILAARNEIELLRRFVDYTISVDFAGSEWATRLARGPSDSERKLIYVDWLRHVCALTAHMIVHWMRVGFVHGVMNTDNMSILGLTIDYGPYGWLENYDPEWTPNTTDAAGRRYRYGQQPQIALWNLVQLANALYPLIEDVPPLETALNHYGDTYEREWRAMVAAKLGLAEFRADIDQALADDLFAILASVETDMTLFFRGLGATELSTTDPAVAAIPAPLVDAYYVDTQIDDSYRARLGGWLERYRARVADDCADPRTREVRMNAVNPRYVLRNYLAQLTIDEVEQGNFAAVEALLDVLRSPYSEQPDKTHYAARRPDWARQRAGCSMLSCSS